MKKYYIHYPNEFANVFSLFSVETEEDKIAIIEIKEKDGERCPITFKFAKEKIELEKLNRGYSNHGFGVVNIIPATLALENWGRHNELSDKLLKEKEFKKWKKKYGNN